MMFFQIELSVIRGNDEIDFSLSALILFLLPRTEEREIDSSAGVFLFPPQRASGTRKPAGSSQGDSYPKAYGELKDVIKCFLKNTSPFSQLNLWGVRGAFEKLQ